MARKINRKPRVKYVPEFDGIRDAFVAGEEVEPVTLSLAVMSAADAYASSDSVLMHVNKKGIAQDTKAAKKAAIIKHVCSVENYSVELQDGRDVQITDGEKLWKYGELGIIDEVLNVLPDLSALQKGDLEKLDSQSSG